MTRRLPPWSTWPARRWSNLAPPEPNRRPPRPERPLTGLAFRNPAVQRLRTLLRDRAARDEQRCFVVEGRKSLEQARTSAKAIVAVYIDPVVATAAERAEAEACASAGADLFELQPGVLERVSDTVSPQPVVAIAERIDVPLSELRAQGPDFLVVCVDVRDPGNLGTILRSSGAAGASAVVCCQGSVDLYNPKAVRSSAGALFRLPVVAGVDAEQVLSEVADWGLTRWGAAADGGMVYTDADLTLPFALVVGNEAHGLPSFVTPHLDGTLAIPMTRGVESLNVATATAVISFESARQRSG